MNKFELIKLNGFELRMVENRYPIFYKQDGKRVLLIGGGDVERSSIRNMECSISFIEIEQYFPRQGDDYSRTISLINHNQVLNKSLGKSFVKENLPFEIEQNDAKSLIELFNSFHSNIAAPFFNKWLDIRSLLPYLELRYDDFLNQNKLFKVHGLLKRMIIWKLCGHPKTEDYIAFHDERFEKILETNQSKKTIKEINRYKEIRDSLMTIEQTYEWDEKYLDQ